MVGIDFYDGVYCASDKLSMNCTAVLRTSAVYSLTVRSRLESYGQRNRHQQKGMGFDSCQEEDRGRLASWAPTNKAEVGLGPPIRPAAKHKRGKA